MKAPIIKCKGTCKQVLAQLLAAATAPTLSHSPATPPGVGQAKA